MVDEHGLCISTRDIRHVSTGVVVVVVVRVVCINAEYRIKQDTYCDCEVGNGVVTRIMGLVEYESTFIVPLSG